MKEISKRDQALFNVRVDLCRITGAWRFIQEVQRPDWERFNLSSGGWFVLVQDSFFERMKVNIRSIPFSSLEYEELYLLIKERKYIDAVVLREEDVESDIWDAFGFDDFLVLQLQRREKGKFLSYTSSGRNFIQLIFDEGYWGHDCDKLPLLYGLMTEAEFHAGTDGRNKVGTKLSRGTEYECEDCGLRSYSTNLPAEKMMDLHEKIMKGIR